MSFSIDERQLSHLQAWVTLAFDHFASVIRITESETNTSPAVNAVKELSLCRMFQVVPDATIRDYLLDYDSSGWPLATPAAT
jgi:hypothetical protein